MFLEDNFRLYPKLSFFPYFKYNIANNYKKVVMKKLSPTLLGLIQAVGVFLYCIFAIFFMNNAQHVVSLADQPSYTFLFLVFFIISALISASIVFAYPIKILFIDKGEKKEALTIVLGTTLWLTIFFVSVVLYLLLT